MSPTHPYRHFQVPQQAPFELKPSPGKRWGIFATRPINKGDIILREKPLFTILKPHEAITELDIQMAFEQLSTRQKYEFLQLRDNATKRFTSMEKAFAENCFQLASPNGYGPQPYGLFLLQSRFNHSCVPNSKIPTTNGETITSFATRNIVAGEEITFCYNPDFECKTRYERQQALGFVCDCKACLPGTQFQQLSDLRRRFIRGLQYLTLGVDIIGHGSGSPIITDPGLRNAAETFSIPYTSRFIYSLLTVFLLEEEGLLDDFMVERICPGIDAMTLWFRTESNVRISRLAMEQGTWLERLSMAFKLLVKRMLSIMKLVPGYKSSAQYIRSQVKIL